MSFSILAIGCFLLFPKYAYVDFEFVIHSVVNSLKNDFFFVEKPM